MKQKLSCLPVSLFDTVCSGDMPVWQWADLAKEIGFQGFDVSSLFFRSHTLSYLEEIKKHLKKTGLPLIMMTTYPDFIHPDRTQRIREHAYFERDVALASELGCQYVRITPGPCHPEINERDGIVRTIDAFADMADYAGNFGIKLVFENHAAPGAWNRFDFSYEPRLFLEICRELKGIGIGVNFDMGNPVAYGYSPLKLLEQIMDLVETVHISDMKESGSFEPCAIGRGVTPIKELVKMLEETGFGGWYSIEEASGQAEKGIRQAYHAVTEIFENTVC